MTYQGGYPQAPIKTIRGRYDFAVDGGAIGAIDLTKDAIPAGAVVLGGYLEVDTALTTGAAGTMAVSVEGANDIQTAVVVSNAPWSTTGRKDVVPDFTGSTAIKTTAARKIVGTIATGALTAGAFDVVLFYVAFGD